MIELDRQLADLDQLTAGRRDRRPSPQCGERAQT
jgi:hypothetical protein